MDEGTKRRWDVRLGIVAPILTLVSVVVGVWQFNAGEAHRREADFRNALLKDDIEFRRKLWLERLDRYRAVSEMAGRIAALPPGKARAEIELQFESAYWGTMMLVEDKAAADAMIGFRQALRDEKSGFGQANDVKTWAESLAKALRASLEDGSPEKLRKTSDATQG